MPEVQPRKIIRVILGYIGIMEKKMETTIMGYIGYIYIYIDRTHWGNIRAILG